MGLGAVVSVRFVSQTVISSQRCEHRFVHSPAPPKLNGEGVCIRSQIEEAFVFLFHLSHGFHQGRERLAPQVFFCSW